MLSCFHLIPESYRRTDGRRDLLYQYRASVCWRAIKSETHRSRKYAGYIPRMDGGLELLWKVDVNCVNSSKLTVRYLPETTGGSVELVWRGMWTAALTASDPPHSLKIADDPRLCARKKLHTWTDCRSKLNRLTRMMQTGSNVAAKTVLSLTFRYRLEFW